MNLDVERKLLDAYFLVEQSLYEEGITQALGDAHKELVYRRQEIQRLRNLISKYAYHVGELEGINFLNSTSDHLTEEECAYIKELDKVYTNLYLKKLNAD